MKSKKVYIVVLNWNGTEDTIECLKSLKQLDYADYQIILVDNKSDELNFKPLIEWCDSNFAYNTTYKQCKALEGGDAQIEDELLNYEAKDRLLIIKNEENLGFAGGNNIATNYILTKEEDAYTLLLNNDTVVEKDSLSHLNNFLESHPDYVACTPQIRLYEPNDIIWNCGGRVVMGNRRYYYNGDNISNVPQEGSLDISFVTGCALFFKPQETGILTEDFFFGEEDFEFSLRLKKENKKMACVFKSVIYHKVSASIKTSNNKSFNRFFLHYASRLINIKSFYSGFNYFWIKRFNLAYALVLLAYKYKQSIKQSLSLVMKISKYSSRNSDLRKESFLRIMNGEY